MESIDGCDQLFLPFIHSYALLLVVLFDLYIFIVSGVGYVYMYGLVVDWVSLCFWVSMLACVYRSSLSLVMCFVLFCVSCVCYFVSLFFCVFVVVTTP